MRTIIINGSPRREGDTSALIAELTGRLDGEIINLSAYSAQIEPCVDCRWCFKNRGCIIRDDMDILYADDFENVAVASPIHMSLLTAPMVGLISRFQCYYAAKRFQADPIPRRPKRGAVMLVGGGDGRFEPALSLARTLLRYLNASLDERDFILSHDTDRRPAKDDQEALSRVRELAARFNNANDEENA